MKRIDIDIVLFNKQLSFSINAPRCCVICSVKEEEITYILRKIGDLDECDINESIHFETDKSPVNIGYFFKQGILLSNLSLLENLELPFKYYYAPQTWGLYREKLCKWIAFFGLTMDLNKRPADTSYSEKKIVSVIRNLILEPDLYLFNDPFFQLSYVYRKKMVDCLMLLKDNNNILTIGSSDLELIELLADDVILIDKGEVIGHYEIMGTQKERSLKEIRDFLNKSSI